jgi:hypothetical protein
MEKAYGSNIYHTTGRKSPSKSLFSAILKENLSLAAGSRRKERRLLQGHLREEKRGRKMKKAAHQSGLKLLK